MRSFIFVGALLVWCAVAGAMPKGVEDENSARIDRFKLWNECAPIRLVVEGVDRNEIAMGLTEEVIITTVRSRLRAARLYTGEEQVSEPYLYVNINTVKSAFSISFSFEKVLFDPISRQTNYATTWREGADGRGDAGYILSAGVSRLTDTFIDEYLRVNEEACQRRK